MKFTLKKLKLLAFIIILFGLIVEGCGSSYSITNKSTSTVVLESPAFPTPTSLLSAFTESPISSITHTPLSPAYTVATSSLSDLPTPSPLPTLPAKDAEIEILDMLLYNEECDFPCWWGIKPGETSLQASRSFLETFLAISVTNIFDENGGYTRWLVKKNDMIIDTQVSIISDLETLTTVEGLWVTTQVTRETADGGFEVVWENPLNSQYLQALMLPQILTTYGQPNNVLIQVNRDWGEFELLLDYSSDGFALWFVAPLEGDETTYLGCMAKAYSDLFFWDPNMGYTWAEGVTRISKGDAWEIDALSEVFLPLEEVTSLTLEEFYQTFKNPENTDCLETSTDFWLGP